MGKIEDAVDEVCHTCHRFWRVIVAVLFALAVAGAFALFSSNVVAHDSRPDIEQALRELCNAGPRHSVEVTVAGRLFSVRCFPAIQI